MLKIDQYLISIKIDEKEIIEDDLIIHSINIYETVASFAPSAELIVFVKAKYVEETPIVDGLKISIGITTNNRFNQNEWMPFRVFNYQIIELGTNGYVYNISCRYDASDLYQSKFEYIEGSSSTVFSKKADEINLEKDIDDSNDKQIWVREGIKGSLFLSNVARHAYSNSNSCFVGCIRRNNTMVFANISKRRDEESKWTFRNESFENLENNTVFYRDPTVASKSGNNNALYGYGRHDKSFNYETGEKDDLLVNTTNKYTKYLSINKELNKRQRSETQPPYIGNTHSKYHLAKIQNLRLRYMNSIQILMITDDLQDVQLLDKVRLHLPSLDVKSEQSTYSVNCFVDMVSTEISSNNLQVHRWYSLVTDGLNPEGEVDTLL